MEEIHSQNQARENWTVLFGKMEYPVFPEEIESN
jgi:hypothetical protein